MKGTIIFGVALASALVIACSGATSGFTVKEQFFVKPSADVTYVNLTDAPMACNGVSSQIKPKGVTNEIILVLAKPAVGKVNVVPKSGSAPNAGEAWAQYGGYADCATKAAAFGTGTIEITAVGARVAGTYEIKFDRDFVHSDGTYSSGSMKGEFNAAECTTTMTSICK